MSHIVTKNGRKTLFVFYDPIADDYDFQTEKALKHHGLEDEPVNIICKPAKERRSKQEIILSIYRQIKTLKEKIEGEGRDPSPAEFVMAQEKMLKIEELEGQIEQP